MRASPRVWFLERLDGFLPEERRRALQPAERSRYRVLLGTTLFLVVLAVPYLLGLPMYPSEERPFHAALGLASLGSYALVLALVRWRPTPTPPALLLCTVMTAGFMAFAHVSTQRGSSTHMAGMLIPTLCVYLLGTRLGLLFTAVFALDVALLSPALSFGAGREPSLDAALGMGTWPHDLMGGISLLLAWALSWLHGSAREEAVTALERALRTLGENEGRLISLLESTDDVVCSLDPQGRLVSTNPAARALFSQLLGREPRVGEPLFDEGPPERRARWSELIARALGGPCVREEMSHRLGDRTMTLELTINPVWAESGEAVGLTLFGRDITAHKEAEARLSELHRTLLDVSRQAGMAEMATGVLHNVGNTLNSVNVSANLVTERLRGLRVSGPARAAQLLRELAEREGGLPAGDARGAQLPAYLVALSEQLTQERDALLAEMGSLNESLEHIKAVVSMQQAHARTAGLVQQVPVPQLIDDALHLHAESFERLGIRVLREYTPVPPLLVDRHKLLQILINLLSNARHALLESAREDKQLTLRVEPVAGERLRIAVADNGVGIAPEHLPRLFTQGFTTKAQGHGFGLHISALAASEMGGALTCASGGPGLGATFQLELPPTPQEARS